MGLVRVAALSTVLLALGACSSADNTAPPALAPAPPVAAVTESETSVAVYAATDTGIADAASEAIEALRAGGAPIARNLGVVAIEPSSDVLAMVDEVNALLDNDPLLLLVGCEREAALLAAELASEAGVLTMAPCSSATELVDGEAPVFGLLAGADDLGAALAAEAVDRRFSNAITVSDVDSLDGHDTCERFRVEYERHGDLLGEVALGPTTDLSVLERIAPAEVLVACFDRVVARERIAAIRDSGFDGPILSSAGLADWQGDEPGVSIVRPAGPWNTASATKAAIEIFAAAAAAVERVNSASMADAIDETGVFATSSGEVRFDDRRSATPLVARPRLPAIPLPPPTPTVLEPDPE